MRSSYWCSDVGCSELLPPVSRLRIVRVCARLLASISADNFEGCAVYHVGGDSEDVLAVSLYDFWKDGHDFASLGPRDAILRARSFGQQLRVQSRGKCDGSITNETQSESFPCRKTRKSDMT